VPPCEGDSAPADASSKGRPDPQCRGADAASARPGKRPPPAGLEGVQPPCSRPSTRSPAAAVRLVRSRDRREAAAAPAAPPARRRAATLRALEPLGEVAELWAYRATVGDALSVVDAVADSWTRPWPRLHALVEDALRADPRPRQAAVLDAAEQPQVQNSFFSVATDQRWVAPLRAVGMFSRPTNARRSAGSAQLPLLGQGEPAVRSWFGAAAEALPWQYGRWRHWCTARWSAQAQARPPSWPVGCARALRRAEYARAGSCRGRADRCCAAPAGRRLVSRAALPARAPPGAARRRPATGRARLRMCLISVRRSSPQCLSRQLRLAQRLDRAGDLAA
jgi:hypothetical protein